MSIKDYLSQACRVNNLIEGKIEQVQVLRDLATKATATLTDMPTGGTRRIHRMEDIIAKMVDLENEINADIDRLLDIKRSIMTAIKTVENPEHRELLELRYLCYKPWEDIAEKMHYSMNWLFKVHRRALADVKLKLGS